jgi:hypothetical protein
MSEHIAPSERPIPCTPEAPCGQAVPIARIAAEVAAIREGNRRLESYINELRSDARNEVQHLADQRVAWATLTVALDELRRLNEAKTSDLDKLTEQVPTQLMVEGWITNHTAKCAATQQLLLPGIIDERLTRKWDRLLKLAKTLVWIVVPLSIVIGIAVAALIKSDPETIGGIIRGFL